MNRIRYIWISLVISLALILVFPAHARAQQTPPQDTGLDNEIDQGLFEDAQEGRGAQQQGGTTAIPPLPPIGGAQTAPPAAGAEGGAPREGETSWDVTINVAVVMNYVFSDSPDMFTIKYRFEIKGEANAETAVLRGDLDINADVEGPLSKWPTGECRLFVTIPKVPYELTFRKSGEDKTNLRLVLKRAVTEDWQSKCTFTDSPGSKLETRGAPETWLAKALEKARPPLKDLMADIGKEEMTTRFIIGKESISDAPLGSGEIEGTGIITIRPRGTE